MAIRIVDQYPGKTAGANSDYPQGQAQNVSTPGDGTGTPWEAAIVNDDQGFKQALLEEAGITPSGNPDTAQESQYLNAMKAIFMGAGGITSIVAPEGAIAIPVSEGSVSKTLRIKWGSRDFASNPGEVAVETAFPTPFPTACFGVVAIRKMRAHTANGDGGIALISYDSTKFNVSLQAFGGSTADLRGFFWVAIGS